MTFRTVLTTCSALAVLGISAGFIHAQNYEAAPGISAMEQRLQDDVLRFNATVNTEVDDDVLELGRLVAMGGSEAGDSTCEDPIPGCDHDRIEPFSHTFEGNHVIERGKPLGCLFGVSVAQLVGESVDVDGFVGHTAIVRPRGIEGPGITWMPDHGS